MVYEVTAGTVSTCFLLIAAVGAVSCSARPDYNLPLFTFLYFFYFNIPRAKAERQQTFLFCLVALTILQDIAYFSFWSYAWTSSSTRGFFASAEVTAHKAVLGLCCIEVLLKLFMLVAMYQQRACEREKELQREDSPPPGFYY